MKKNQSQLINDQLKACGCVIERYREADKESLYQIFKEIIEAGSYFPHDKDTYEEFMHCFFALGSHVYVCRSEEGVIGGFYLKANFPGRASHIANAAYMIKKTSRGKGLGRLLGESSLCMAKGLGFQAIQLNVVLSQNLTAVNLYKKLGFHIIGTIPQAIRNSDNSYQEGYIMFQSLPNDKC